LSGGGGTSSTAAAVITNGVPIIVDAGPAQVDAVNTLYTSVTL
jgi:hypothetical protein